MNPARHLSRRLLAASVAAQFLFVSSAAQAAEASRPPSPPVANHNAPVADEQLEGKVAWGLLLNLVAPTVFEVVGKWLAKKLVPKIEGYIYGDESGSPQKATLVETHPTLDSPGAAKNGSPGVNTQVGTPSTPFKLENGKENYHAAHLALVGVDASGRVTGVRTVADGFRTGERFKVRVIATFDADLSLYNVTPKKRTQQIYPAAQNQAIRLTAGQEVLLPLERNAFFQFTGDVGEDLLVISMIAARANEIGTRSDAPVFRQDEPYGSNFVQEVRADTYPAMVEKIAIKHY